MRSLPKRRRGDSLIGQIVAANVVLVTLTLVAASVVASLDRSGGDSAGQLLVLGLVLILTFGSLVAAGLPVSDVRSMDEIAARAGSSKATIYRRCRRAGITPRGLLDCMITAVAVRHDVPVLSHDADLARIARVTSLRLDDASLRSD